MKEEHKSNKWLHVRLTFKEYDRIQEGIGQTVHDSLSDYASRFSTGIRAQDCKTYCLN